MHFPLWLILPLWPLWAWPVTLPLTVGLIWLAVRYRGWRRWVGLTIIAIMVVPLLSVAGFVAVFSAQNSARRQAEHASTHSVMERETTLDGVTLPVGTEMRWTNATQTQWASASFLGTIEFHGLPVRRMINQRPGWSLTLAEPRRIGGWNCAATEVALTAEGDLLSCRLSDAATWQGWSLPARTGVTLRRTERTLTAELPDGARIEAAGTRRSLPSGATLNEDGSPATAFYRTDEQLEVAGVSLWQQITWTYDPATFGQGRNRPPITVRGMRAATEGMIRPDGTSQMWEWVVVDVVTGSVQGR
jgi:hypothetical protein